MGDGETERDCFGIFKKWGMTLMLVSVQMLIIVLQG